MVTWRNCHMRGRAARAVIAFSLMVLFGAAIRADRRPMPVSARELLRQSRNLTQAEVEHVVNSALATMSGKAFRGYVGPATHVQILMDSRARPTYLLVDLASFGTVFEEHTSRPAVTCDGEPLDSRLYIEYGLNEHGKWDVTAYPERDWHSMPKYYDIFTKELTVGEFKEINEHQTRALIGPMDDHDAEPGHQAADVQQAIWLDLNTLLPVRWEMVVNQRATDYAVTFWYDSTLVLRPPPVKRKPVCVDYGSR